MYFAFRGYSEEDIKIIKKHLNSYVIVKNDKNKRCQCLTQIEFYGVTLKIIKVLSKNVKGKDFKTEYSIKEFIDAVKNGKIVKGYRL